MSDKDTIAALQRNLAAAEVERLRLVAEVERLTKALDVCSSVHAHNVKLHEERKRLREALRRVMGLDGRDETFCLDQKCGTCDECFARAALAGEEMS